jgi:hypothetical protein
MNSEEQFKDSLRNLVESKEFPFDENNWEKAEEMMHPKETKRRAIVWSLAALLFVVLGVFSYYYFMPAAPAASQNTGDHKNLIPGNKLPAVAENSGAFKKYTSTAAAKASSPSIIHNAVKSSQEPALQPKKQAGSFVASAQKTKPASPQLQQAPATVPAVAGSTVVEQPVVVAQPHHAVNSTPEEPVAAKQATATEALKENSNKAEQPDAAIEAPVKTAANKPATVPAEHRAEKTIPAPIVSEAKANTEKNNTPVVNTQQAPEPPFVFLPLKPVALPVAKIDSVLITRNTANDLPLPAQSKRIIMSFEVGATYLAGWNNHGKTDAQGFNPVVGFNYYNYLTDKLAVSFGAQYTSVSHLNYTSVTSQTIRYNLGEENAVTVITPQKVHYLAIPVKLNYMINTSNAIGIGCNVAYMLTVDSKEETYTERLNRRDDYKSFKTSDYTEGFAAFDTQLSLFYRRKIYKNLSVNAEIIYGLTDIKNNSFFNSSVVERNKGIKLTLHYNLFK